MNNKIANVSLNEIAERLLNKGVSFEQVGNRVYRYEQGRKGWTEIGPVNANTVAQAMEQNASAVLEPGERLVTEVAQLVA